MIKKQQNQMDDAIYILMISVHGLIRTHDLELGRDADTGGQTTYVLELAKALAKHHKVNKVDLLTRLIEDPSVSADYAQSEEIFENNTRLVRLPCGPKKYVRKEMLWPHLDQMVDKTLSFLRQQGRLPNVIHSHYADAGYVGKQLSMLLGIPLIHTGHSLGLPKKSRLLASGRKESAIERQFNLNHRISVEQDVLQHASLIVTSTRQEVEEQYGMYQSHSSKRFSVIPPGTDTSRFSPVSRKKISTDLLVKVDRFLYKPEKPIILSISRPVMRKNIQGLIKAYGNNKELQENANLVIVAGVRDDIRRMEESQQAILHELLLDIDQYDLWGKVAIPKHITQNDIPELYRLTAKRHGVFVNPAFTEPFGLTLIEAAASGLPFVAPNDGGPRDIIANCRSGLLANTLNDDEMAKTINQVLSNKKQWKRWSKSGVTNVKNHYSWDAHVTKYMKEVSQLLRRDYKRNRRQHVKEIIAGKLPMPLVKMMIISDIDNTLIGDKSKLAELINWLHANAESLGFGVATGRTLESTVAILKKHRVPLPNILITSVGSEIHYGPSLVPDTGWANHIRHQWRRDDLAKAMLCIPGLQLQTQDNQREFKLSYIVKPSEMPPLTKIYEHLHNLKLNAQLIYSHNQFLDILPVRASKGHAIRYLAYKWDLPLKHFLVAGDSGNDSEMLVGDTLAVVVGNHSSELEYLRGLDQVYFAEKHYAAGILEGLVHYGFGRFNLENNNNEALEYV